MWLGGKKARHQATPLGLLVVGRHLASPKPVRIVKTPGVKRYGFVVMSTKPRGPCPPSSPRPNSAAWNDRKIRPAVAELLGGYRAMRRPCMIELEGSRGMEAGEHVVQAAATRAPRGARGRDERRAALEAAEAAFARTAHLAPYLVMGGVIHAQLPYVCADPRDRSRARPRVGNVFHAGDGNLHPISCTTPVPGEDRGRRRAKIWKSAPRGRVDLGETASGREGVNAADILESDLACMRLWGCLNPTGAAPLGNLQEPQGCERPYGTPDRFEGKGPSPAL